MPVQLKRTAAGTRGSITLADLVATLQDLVGDDAKVVGVLNALIQRGHLRRPAQARCSMASSRRCAVRPHVRAPRRGPIPG